MKLHPASRKEVKRIAIGTGICSTIMIAGMGAFSFAGIGSFDYRVFIGAIGGSIAAVLNFTILCLTVQNAVNIPEEKRRKAFLQGSYNGRLLLQAGWVMAAFVIPHINVVAASLPLLFPNLSIFFLQKRGA